ncbi:MAG TPA: TlpA disulfide reductase family protein [Bdellovibrionota bacterium]
MSAIPLYLFWEWGAAKVLVGGVRPPAAVEAVHLGAPAPDLTINKNQVWSKQDFHLSSLRGYPAIVHFWATWCAPCVQELPELLARAKLLRRQGFSVVTVAVDESWEKLAEFFRHYPALRDIQNHSILVLDPGGKIAEKFGSSRFPESFLINDSLVIDNKLVGPQPWSSAAMDPYLQRLRAAKRAK